MRQIPMTQLRSIKRKVFNFSEGPWWFWVLWTFPFGAITTFWLAWFAAVVSTFDLPAWTEAPINFLCGACIMTGFSTAIYLIACPILIVAFAFKNERRKYIPAAIVLLVIAIAPFFVSEYVFAFREHGLRRATENSKPLIAAIEKYKTDTGKYPTELELLVPKYLASIPETGMAGAPVYRYAQPRSDEKFTGYSLFVACGYGLQFDQLAYWPNHDSPSIKMGNGGGSRKIGDWYYLRD